MLERNPWEVVRRLAEHIECRTVVDVGAYHGSIADWFHKTFPHAQIYAFEPDPRSFGELRRNLAHLPRAHPSNVALSSHAREAQFHLGFKGFTSSLLPREKKERRYFHRDYTMVDSVDVKTETLDSLFQDKRIDILKLDTQGSELEILKGAQPLLQRGCISIIVTEFFFVPHYENVPLLDEIWSYLRRFGYGLYDLFSGPHAANGQIRYGDAIFVSP